MVVVVLEIVLVVVSVTVKVVIVFVVRGWVLVLVEVVVIVVIAVAVILVVQFVAFVAVLVVGVVRVDLARSSIQIFSRSDVTSSSQAAARVRIGTRAGLVGLGGLIKLVCRCVLQGHMFSRMHMYMT